MRIKGIIAEDFVNYKVPSLTIESPICKDFKCDRECGVQVCQNWSLAKAPIIDIPNFKILDLYFKSDITKAICFQGLEPFDTFDDLWDFLLMFRCCGYEDDVVIYTGYKEEEIASKIKLLTKFKNIIIKFGRYIPDQEKHYDEVLGVELASPNQYARRIS